MSCSVIQLPMIDADVRYYPNFIDSDTADQQLTDLLSVLHWQQDDIKMFGRTVRIPRLQAWYGDKNAQYRYSGKTMQPKPWHPQLLTLKSSCEALLNCQFNSVLANCYRNGEDCMGWHADDEPELVRNGIIASVSLGAERDFDFRHKHHSKEVPQQHRLTLEHGSLLVMNGDTQNYWKHALPRRKACKTPRINLTFRCIIPNYHV